jgi:hypothetical protein
MERLGSARTPLAGLVARRAKTSVAGTLGGKRALFAGARQPTPLE